MVENINPFTGRPYGTGFTDTLTNPNITNRAVLDAAKQGLTDAARREEDMRRLAPLLEVRRIQQITQERAEERQAKIDQQVQAAERAALQAGGPNMSATEAKSAMEAAREQVLAGERQAELERRSASDMLQPNALGVLKYGPMLPGESPAAYYMRTKAAERKKALEMGKVGLLGVDTGQVVDETSPARVTNFALKTGNEVGDNNRERSFLERLSQSGLLSIMQGMPRAERMYNVGPLAAFTESALDVQAARSAAEQKQREMKLELAKEQIKAGDGSDAIRKMLAKGETQKLLSTAGNTFQMINASEKIRKILGVKGASGLANAAKTWATQFGNIFGFNLEATSKQKVEDIIGMLEQQMAGSRIFGRDLSRFDYEVLAKVLKSPGIVESDERIRDQYKTLINGLEKTHAQSVKSLNILIGRDTTQQLLGQSNTTGNLFLKVE